MKGYREELVKLSEFKSLHKYSEYEKDNSNKTHYVYRITNIVTGMHYYGSRTCIGSPKEDLGIKYFSSITNKRYKFIIEDQKVNRQNYKYKIVKICKNTEEKNIYESYIHYKFNVKDNERFYNLHNQAPKGFDTSARTILKSSVERRLDTISSLEWKETKGKEMSVKMKMTKNSKEWKETIGKKSVEKQLKTKGSKEWKETKGKDAIDKVKKTRSDESWLETKGKEMKLKISNTLKENGTCSGKNNPNAKIIYIFDNNDKLKFICNGNFYKICSENNLPAGKLSETYKGFTTTVKTKSFMFRQYNGWYAKIIPTGEIK